MEPILVYPHNADELNALKEFLETSKIQFELQNDELPPHVLKSIERGLKQSDNGQTISFEEFKAKHLQKSNLF